MIELALYCAGFSYGLHIFYAGVMNVMRVKDGLNLFWKIYWMPWIVLFVLLDAIYNATVGSVLFFEPPQWHRKDKYGRREWLMTARLKRHAQSVPSTYLGKYRKWLAVNYCHRLLDELDPSGDHC